MKKMLTGALLIAAMGSFACGGKSNQDVCLDSCNALNKCSASANSTSSGSTGGTTGSSPAIDCNTICTASTTTTTSSTITCDNGKIDSCVNAVDTSKYPDCATAIGKCSSDNCK